jgi:hypothetical protein
VIDESDLQYQKQFDFRNFNIPSDFNFRWSRKISNQFVTDNINQKIVFNHKDLIPWFNWD